MNQYHKIQSLYKRDQKGKMLFGEYSLPEFDYLKDNMWEFTEKVDGTNIRIMWDAIGVRFGGKTDNAQIPSPLVTKLIELFPDKKLHEVFPYSGEPMKVCLYGEGYGAKIQKGGGNYIPDGVDFILFDVKVGDWWLKREDVEDVASKLGIDTVPVLCFGTLEFMEKLCEDGFKSQWGDFIAEGIVARPQVELRDRAGHRIITKLKHKDFQDV